MYMHHNEIALGTMSEVLAGPTTPHYTCTYSCGFVSQLRSLTKILTTVLVLNFNLVVIN